MFFKHIIQLSFLTSMFSVLTVATVNAQEDVFITYPTDSLFNPEISQDFFWNDSTGFYFDNTIPVNSLFMPVVYKGKLLPDDLQLYTPVNPWKEPAYIPEQEPITLFEKELYIQELKRQAYLYLIKNSPMSVKYSEVTLPKDIPVSNEIKVNPFKQIFDVDNTMDFASSGAPEIVRPKRRYWIASYETSVQFSQNYISENWYKGGNSNFNLRSFNKFRHEYEKNRVKISNAIEYKLSLYTTPTDTLRSYRIGDDAFSIISSYGYKAFDHWYYSLSLDFRTQFFSNYYENQMTKSSAFLSPMVLNLGLGMEYKLSKTDFANRHKKLELSANIAPFSYNMKYLLDDEDELKKRHGFLPDEDFIKNLGSKIITTLQFNINRNVSWNSKLYYFTNYEKVEAELENTLNLAMSRFFSTIIYFDVRFDDSVEKANPSDSYFQYYEILSFGFNYKF